ncbi:MAG: hypothetical protein O7B29_06195, partial [Deltaproteobacteria bacterium]|nr:hypothetical protein [Deltaproteobacteria bacterium]
MSHGRFLLLSFLLSSLLVLPVQAQDPAVEIWTFDNYMDFNTAYPTGTVFTFEDQGPLDVFFGETGFQEAGTTITATDDFLFVRSNGDRNGFIYGGLGPTPSGDHVRIDLPPDTNAFGAHMTGFFVRLEGEVKVTLSTGQEFQVAVTGLWYTDTLDPRDPESLSSFFGVISAEPFEWVTIEMVSTDYIFSDTDYVVLDTVTFGHFEVVETAFVGVQSKDQRKCIVAMNKRGAKLAKAHNKSAYECLKHAAEGKRKKLGPGGDIASCLTADVKGRVDRAVDKLLRYEDKKCLAADRLPDYAYLGSVAVVTAADDETWGMLQALFGDPANLDHVASSGGADSDSDS